MSRNGESGFSITATPVLRPRGQRNAGEEATCSLKMPHKGFVIPSFSPEREFTLQTRGRRGEISTAGAQDGIGPFLLTKDQLQGMGESGGEQRLGQPCCRGSRAMALHLEKRKRRNKSHTSFGRIRQEPSAPGRTERLWSPQPLPAPLLYQFHIIGREHAEVAVGTVATPPAFVNHLDVGDDVLRIK